MLRPVTYVVRCRICWSVRCDISESGKQREEAEGGSAMRIRLHRRGTRDTRGEREKKVHKGMTEKIIGITRSCQKLTRWTGVCV